MNSRRRIILSLSLTFCYLVVGTVGYVTIEDYTPLEAIYMAVITITTVGYGEIHALSETGRIFTMFLLLFGVGSLAFAAHSFAESMIERASSPVRGKRVIEKRSVAWKTILLFVGMVGWGLLPSILQTHENILLFRRILWRSVKYSRNEEFCM